MGNPARISAGVQDPRSQATLRSVFPSGIVSMISASGDPGLRAYLQEVWQGRYFWMSLVRMDLRSRYRGSALGMGWSLLNPVFMTIIFCTVFATLFQQDVYIFAPYVMTGLAVWNFLSQSMILGSNCFHQSEVYIRQHPAPLAIYPLRVVLGNCFHFIISAALAVFLALWGTGWPGLMPLLSLVPTLGLFLVFGWSLACILGLMTVHFRDVKHLTEVGMQVLMYLTPVWYPAKLLQEKGLGWVVYLNPLAPFLELVRTPLLDHTLPTPLVFGSALAVALSFLTVAGLALRLREPRLIFYL
ncbi:MAG: ABC transporter permease [Planctomycetota bacterium]|nr:ABC transporter permease [Planctomycetota bacterium]RLS40820.1 MAG: ABC transporter permease [Planctomycetota bacterium]